ncbi:MAG: serine hydrolase [Roseiflexaceae bacterium]|nr:serine hydrolase [Roseiflexaceae bacterium]
MLPMFRALTLLLSLLLVACSTPAASSALSSPLNTATIPPPVPTSTAIATVPIVVPTPTANPTLVNGVFVAGIDVGGKTADQARQLLEQQLDTLLRPIDVRAADAQLTIRPDEIGAQLNTDALLADALAAKSATKIPLQIAIDQTLLETKLGELAKQVDQPSTISLITATKSISRSFALVGGRHLDIPDAIAQIETRLQSPGSPRRITLSLTSAAPNHRPTPEQLQQQIETMAKQWNGIVGIYVYDLNSKSVVAQLNQNTVFSGASVMKVPIMLQTYLNIPKFNVAQERALQKMIVDSDNFSANVLLAASVGGGGTDDALAGALAMSKMLSEQLGLKHTYQNMPYEARDYLVNVRGIKIKRGPAQEGQPPYTDPDPVLRTTPAEMSQVFLLIEQCRNGEGRLLDTFPQLTKARCAEMISRLEKNGDASRMRSGLPKNIVVAHKSGWIEDMQADVGIIRSPGGDFLMAIYVYTDIRPTKIVLTDKVAAPVIGHFARLIYSFYNPVTQK